MNPLQAGLISTADYSVAHEFFHSRLQGDAAEKVTQRRGSTLTVRPRQRCEPPSGIASQFVQHPEVMGWLFLG